MTLVICFFLRPLLGKKNRFGISSTLSMSFLCCDKKNLCRSGRRDLAQGSESHRKVPSLSKLLDSQRPVDFQSPLFQRDIDFHPAGSLEANNPFVCLSSLCSNGMSYDFSVSSLDPRSSLFLNTPTGGPRPGLDSLGPRRPHP